MEPKLIGKFLNGIRVEVKRLCIIVVIVISVSVDVTASQIVVPLDDGDCVGMVDGKIAVSRTAGYVSYATAIAIDGRQQDL